MRLSSLGGAVVFAAASACSLIVDTSGYSGGGGTTITSADAGGVDGGGTTDGSVRIPGTCADASVDPSLVLYLPFDEPDGQSFGDCSGHDHAGQIVGTGVTHSSGHVGGAITLDGSGGCVSIANSQDIVLSGAFTLAAWVKVEQFEQPVTLDSRQIIAKTTKGQDRGWRIVSDNADTAGVLGIKVGQTSGTTFSVETPSGQPLATWLHIAVAWTPGSRADVYVNGGVVTTNPSLPPVIDDPSAPVFVGCLKMGSGAFMGSIDEMRVYTRALQASEIAALAR